MVAECPLLTRICDDNGITMMIIGSSSVKQCSWLAFAGQNLPVSVMMRAIVIMMMIMLMRIGSSYIEQCNWLNNGDGDDADEDRC